MAFLLGASWWSDVPESRSSPPSYPLAPSRTTRPPSVYITMSCDDSPLRDVYPTEWMSHEGDIVRECAEEGVFPIAGRTVGRGFAVTLPAGELDKASTKVRAVVTVVAAGEEPIEDRILGKFAGKPITVISKPLKTPVGTRSGSQFFAFPLSLFPESLPLTVINLSSSRRGLSRRDRRHLQPNEGFRRLDSLPRRLGCTIVLSQD
jgi:hypothetical protein